MNEKNTIKKYTPILEPYGVEPNFVEEFGRIVKIYCSKGTFALKSIDPHKGSDFIRHVRTLYQKGYNRIVPIYPTVDGRYAVLHDHKLYYLMPWLPNEDRESYFKKHQQMFRELARLHILSSKEVKVEKEDREEHYENTLLELEKEQEFLDGYIEECENTEYMSPFQWMFCMYYHDVRQALKYSETKLKEWYEETKDDEKARVSIIHGKISPEHFLYDEKGYGYFTNFENAKFGSPSHDLLPFIARSLKTAPKQNNDCLEWIYTYFNYYPLKSDEMLLFLSYLAHPGPVIRICEKYHKSNKKKNERKYAQSLLKQYWLLKNTEYIVMRIDEMEREKKAQQEAQKETQDS
ncbi:spore coat protein YsxE [Niallia taxi]|uniref:spore coat protein YsxE n=1 Tax=Niallia taxi TaxID=2499688 RepID=UPI0011A7B687|nr:spore coat protein YsxE [Niallia taxi]MCT2343120.1 spore coat protein YsxE [Niallia taxi]WOD64157.1 spore coat protein YsxE [Niallia taxi]